MFLEIIRAHSTPDVLRKGILRLALVTLLFCYGSSERPDDVFHRKVRATPKKVLPRVPEGQRQHDLISRTIKSGEENHFESSVPSLSPIVGSAFIGVTDSQSGVSNANDSDNYSHTLEESKNLIFGNATESGQILSGESLARTQPVNAVSRRVDGHDEVPSNSFDKAYDTGLSILNQLKDHLHQTRKALRVSKDAAVAWENVENSDFYRWADKYDDAYLTSREALQSIKRSTGTRVKLDVQKALHNLPANPV